METSVAFTERERTREQRQDLIDKARAWSTAQGAVPSPRAEALYARYVAGELTLQGITDELRRQDAHRHRPAQLAQLPPLAPAPAQVPEALELV